MSASFTSIFIACGCALRSGSILKSKKKSLTLEGVDRRIWNKKDSDVVACSLFDRQYAPPHRIWPVWRRHYMMTSCRLQSARTKTTTMNNKEKHNFFHVFSCSLSVLFELFSSLHLFEVVNAQYIQIGHKKSNINSAETVFMPTKLINVITANDYLRECKTSSW